MSEYRDRLPDRRFSITETMFFQGEKYHLTIGFYDVTHRRIGEVFLVRIQDKSAAKVGNAQLEAVCRDAAIIISIALQYRVSLRVLQEAMTRDASNNSQSILASVIDELIKHEDANK